LEMEILFTYLFDFISTENTCPKQITPECNDAPELVRREISILELRKNDEKTLRPVERSKDRF